MEDFEMKEKPCAAPSVDVRFLKDTLKLNSITSVPSSYKAQPQAAANDLAADSQHAFVEIGAGLQGAVFEQLGNPLALEKEHPGNSKLRTNLENEYALHKAVREAFDLYDGDSSSINSQVRVPRLHGLIRPEEGLDDSFWSKLLGTFPPEYQNRDLILKMDRIMPLSKTTRQALLIFFSQLTTDCDMIKAAGNDPKNKHCLVRTYLGTTKPSMSLMKDGSSFSL